MRIYPAIDLRHGRCVRLRQGQFDQETRYDTDPVALSAEYAAAGATHLHTVDLDGAKEKRPMQTEIIARMAEASGLHIQAGGGVRTPEDAQHLVQAGVASVVIGSVAVRDPEGARHIVTAVGPERVTLAVDVRIRAGIPRVATEGWENNSQAELWRVLDTYAQEGVRTVLCTDIDRDGMLGGPNLELYREIVQRHPEVCLLASGGVGTLDDLERLRDTRIAGAVVGKALLEGRFSLAAALAM